MLTRSQVKADTTQQNLKNQAAVDPQVLKFLKLLAMEEMPGWRPPAKKSFCSLSSIPAYPKTLTDIIKEDE
ncbi:hypothetical protein L5515_019618 [Caenorhabditis briggsae]|uniref:Uncharacterized protein n=1 Tax=Caenorhabditis briggsae TaxID=6238 RepID=A0AAE9JVM3_CAEBR|nr:hypothetical protein L5515_019618 [Caenorhabditis briggsae]